MKKKQMLATLVMLSLMQESVYATEFNEEVLEYNDVVTAQNGEVQIDNNREYTFRKGGELGPIWVLYDGRNVVFNIENDKMLTVGVGAPFDGLQVSEADLTIIGGDFKTITNSSDSEASALNVNNNGHITINVNNYTSVNGKESALKLMSDYDGRGVDADINVANNLIIQSGGTGIAMEASYNGSNVYADIKAKNIDISTVEDPDTSRLGGLYLLAYKENSKELTLKMNATEDFKVTGYKYAFAGWGNLAVDLQSKNLTLKAGDMSKSTGIYLDATDKAQTHDVKFIGTETLNVSGQFGIRQYSSDLKLQGSETNIYGTTSNGVYMTDSDLSITGNTVKVFSNSDFGIEAKEQSNVNIVAADLTVSGGGLMDSFNLNDSDVTLKTVLGTINNRIAAEDGSTFKAQAVEGSNAYYSIKTHDDDALYSVSDTGEKSVIDIETSALVSNQGDSTDYDETRDKYAALHALRNSEINLNTTGKQYQIYGDIIAGRGIEESEVQGGVINIGGTGSVIKGDVLAGNTGEININLNNGSIEGRVDDYADASLSDDPNKEDVVFRPGEFDVDVTKGGTVNMKLNNSNWDARGQSFVTKLTFENGGSVNLVDDNEADGSGAQGNSVTIRNLEGNGTFNMTLNSADHSLGDMLYIGKNEGNQTINIVGGITGGLENISKDNPLRFATVGIDGSNLPDVQSGSVSAYTRDAGFADIEYYVDKEDFKKEDAENEKYNGNGNGVGVDKPGNDFVENKLVGKRDTAVNWIITGAKELGTGGSQVSDAGKTIINMSKVNYNNAIYMDRLNKRLGEARYINPEDEQGMWVRIRHDRIGKDDAFRSQNTMYEMGYDEKQECDNGERRVGFAIDYMDGKAEYTGIAGSGDVKRYGLWLYDTWMGDKGHYADYVAKWGHLENDFDIMARSTGEKINGDYSNNVFSVSAEYGRKKDIGNDWYVEPQAQLQLARVTGADYTTSQGTRVSLDGINSLIGRAGFRLGRDVDERSTVYIKADLLHEFLGEQDMHVVDNTFNGSQSFENKGTWYDVGFGFATALGKDSYAFMDFEKSFGNDNDETYQINAGVQWTF